MNLELSIPTLNGTTPTNASIKYMDNNNKSTKTLKYFAIDSAGNKSPIYIQTYMIDKIAPKVDSTSPLTTQ